MAHQYLPLPNMGAKSFLISDGVHLNDRGNWKFVWSIRRGLVQYPGGRMGGRRTQLLVRMRKIRLSDMDVELFDIEISPMEFLFYQRHKDAFRTMWREQGKPFWMRFVITFRSFTVKHGVIKQMNIDSMKFENLIDQAFIFVHEQYVDGKENMAKNFVEDVARLAQNQDKFPALDSKSFARDPFYLRETRELFRRFFGMPDQKSSYLKVYILSPIFMRFGGAVCRCLVRWLDAPIHPDPNDTSYWVAPTAEDTVSAVVEKKNKKCTREMTLCSACVDDCGTKFFNEKIYGARDGPKSLTFWQLGDPRFNDNLNPLYAPYSDRSSDWRDSLSVEMFREFLHYCKFKYGTDDDKCKECLSLNSKASKSSRSEKKKHKKKQKDVKKDVHTKGVEELKNLVIDMDLAGDNDDVSGEAFINKLLECQKLKGAKTPADALQQILDDNPNIKSMLNGMPNVDREQFMKDMPFEGADPNMRLADWTPTQTLGKFPEQGASQQRKDIFSKNAKVTDDYKCGILASDATAANKNIVGGFKVVRINDEKAGMYEVNITVTALKGDGAAATRQTRPPRQTVILYPLTSEILLAKIAGLPRKLEWYEGMGWCATVLDYSEEESASGDKPTNFTVKVSDSDEDTQKRTMIQILHYVCQRKKRPCAGWCLDVDDIVACILPDESPNQEGLNICIMRGFRFEERLTDYEKQSLQKHSTMANDIVMGLKEGMAARMLAEDGGEEKLIKLIKSFSGNWQHPSALANRQHMRIVTLQFSKASKPAGPTIADTDPFFSQTWEKMMKNPSKFEMFVLTDPVKEEELASQGMVRVPMEEFRKIRCPMCGHDHSVCECARPQMEASFLDHYINQCDKAQVDKAVDMAVNAPPAGPRDANKNQAIPLPPPPPRPRANAPPSQNPDDAPVKAPAETQSVPPVETKRPQSKKESKTKLPAMESGSKSGAINGKGNTTGKGSGTKKGNNSANSKSPEVEITSKKVETSTNFPFKERKVEINARLPPHGQMTSPDNMAPVPGMSSTINFTINNGQKEQNISIQLGAYMSHDKLKEMEERNKEIKHLEAFTNCVQAESHAAMTTGPPGQYAKEKLFEAVAANLPPDLQSRMKFDVQPPTSKGKNEKQVPAKSANTSNITISPPTESKSPTSKAKPKKPVPTKSANTSNVNISTATESKSKSTKPTNKEAKLGTTNDFMAEVSRVAEDVTNSIFRGDHGNSATSNHGKSASHQAQSGRARNGGNEGKKKGKGRKQEKTDTQQEILKCCGNCDKEEPTRKAFKKCQKCKDEGVLDVRYYCSRDCQVDDWKERHRNDHRDGRLL